MKSVEWPGVLLARKSFNPEYVAERDRLADVAKRGDWPAMFAILDGAIESFTPGANDWRVGGASWYSPLHQVAWLGAPTDVAQGLVDRGAWRTLREASGHRPLDLATSRGHDHLREVLAPTFSQPIGADDLAAMSERLAELVTSAAREVVDEGTNIRHLDVTGIAESGASVWFPIPGMYGGFAVELYRNRLHVESWSRVIGGSGRAYVITPTRTTLVDEGFV